jgi:low temperature requirement protein LtrA
MIFWKGYGYLVLVIAVVIGAVAAFIFSKSGSIEDLGAAVGAILSGVVIWVVSSRLNSTTKERTIVDKKTGKEVILKPNNSLLFIKMQY